MSLLKYLESIIFYSIILIELIEFNLILNYNLH
jgi:hypothetical protein